MKKRIIYIFSLLLCVFGLASCNGKVSAFDATKNIQVYSRDTTSGTRDGFFTALGHSEAKEDDTLLANGTSFPSSNGEMVRMIENDEYGIGYVSLASVIEEQDKLKALTFNNVVATEEAVVDGSYKLSRNFNYITRVYDSTNEVKYNLVYTFFKYVSSQEGQAIIKSNDGILENPISSALSFKEITANDEIVKETLTYTDKVTIKLGGSTSVEKISKALSSAFSEVCKAFVPSHNHTGSGDAYKRCQGSEKDSANYLDIGFLSREINSSETVAENTSGRICKDGIVAVVNPKNTVISNADADLLWKIFSGEITTWNL